MTEIIGICNRVGCNNPLFARERGRNPVECDDHTFICADESCDKRSTQPFCRLHRIATPLPRRTIAT